MFFKKYSMKLRLLSRTWPNISKLERAVLILRPDMFIAAVVKRLVPANLNAWRHRTTSVRLVLWWALPVCPCARVPVDRGCARVPVCPCARGSGLCPGARVPGPATSPEVQKWHAGRQLQSVFWFPKQFVHTEGFLTVGVKAGAWSGCSSLWSAACYL